MPERHLVARRKVVDPEHRTAPRPGADDPDVVLRRRLLHPGLECEGSVVEGAEAGEPDVVVRAVERERAAVSSRRPRRADHGAVLAGAGRVDGRRARALVECVRGDEPRSRRGGESRRSHRQRDECNPYPQHQPHQPPTLPLPSPCRSQQGSPPCALIVRSAVCHDNAREARVDLADRWGANYAYVARNVAVAAVNRAY